MLGKAGSLIGHGGVSVPSPVLSSLNYVQGDTAGGGNLIRATGTDLFLASVGDFGGSPATVSAIDPGGTWVDLILPAHAAGSAPVSVTTPGGTSNTLAFTFWDPTQDADSTLVFDCLTNAYNAGTGEWVPRFTPLVLSSLAKLINPPFAASNHPMSGGAPVFDGDGSGQGGLVSNGAVWSDFLGADTGGDGQPGTIWAVFSSTNDVSPGDDLQPATPYATRGMAVGSMHPSSGTIGLGFGYDTGTAATAAFGHMYDQVLANYRQNNVPASAGQLMTLLSRVTATPAGTFAVSRDGALSGAAYSSVTSRGHDPGYSNQPLHLGVSYDATGVGNQLFKGTVVALGVLSASCSDAFITKLKAWRDQRWA